MNKGLILFALILIAGCTGEGPAFENRVNSSHPLDDGGIMVFRDNTAFGMISGEGEDLLLGSFKAGNFSVISRVLYRFNVSDWNGTSVVFHSLCTGVYGNPGALSVLLVNDFGRLPLRPSQPMDVNSTWLMSGDLISEISPQPGDWFTINIPADKITNPLALMIQLSDESIADGNYYALHSYERGESRGQQKPYLTYTGGTE